MSERVCLAGFAAEPDARPEDTIRDVSSPAR
jgi:hypothetical protein